MSQFNYCHKFLGVIAILFASTFGTLHAKEYNVKYGKYTHIRTNGQVLHRIIGNDTWEIQPSPLNDGIFIWAKKNSIPVNVKLYTETHEFDVDLFPHKTNHTARIVPIGVGLPPKTAVVPISEKTDIELLKSNARNKIIGQKTVARESELSQVPTKEADKPINIRVVNEGDEPLLPLPVDPNPTGVIAIPLEQPQTTLANNSPTNNQAATNDIAPFIIQPKSIRKIINTFLENENEGYVLVELYGDDELLSLTSQQETISDLNDVYQASEGRVSKIFLDREGKTVRVK